MSETFFAFDFWVMLAASLMLVPFVIWRKNITRLVGAGFALLYVAYVVYVIA